MSSFVSSLIQIASFTLMARLRDEIDQLRVTNCITMLFQASGTTVTGLFERIACLIEED